jgi:hypothetical protein
VLSQPMHGSVIDRPNSSAARSLGIARLLAADDEVIRIIHDTRVNRR